MSDLHDKTSAFDRRQMLAAMLGLPALIGGCNRKADESRRFTGRIIGPSDKLGHRLRNDERPVPADDAWDRCGVVIVGGGIAGLAAAWRLQKAGISDFTLIEMEPRPGGTSASGTSDISAFPWAAHYVPVPMKENAALVSLLDEMGVLEGRDAEGEPVVAEQFLCRDPQERVFYTGHWYEGLYLYAGATAEDRAQLQAFQAEMDRWAGWRDVRAPRVRAARRRRAGDGAKSDRGLDPTQHEPGGGSMRTSGPRPGSAGLSTTVAEMTTARRASRPAPGRACSTSPRRSAGRA